MAAWFGAVIHLRRANEWKRSRNQVGESSSRGQASYAGKLKPLKESHVFHRSDYVFITAAFLSFLFSVYLWFSGQREEGMFVGIWVPSILSFSTLVAQVKAR